MMCYSVYLSPLVYLAITVQTRHSDLQTINAITPAPSQECQPGYKGMMMICLFWNPNAREPTQKRPTKGCEAQPDEALLHSGGHR